MRNKISKELYFTRVASDKKQIKTNRLGYGEGVKFLVSRKRDIHLELS